MDDDGVQFREIVATAEDGTEVHLELREPRSASPWVRGRDLRTKCGKKVIEIGHGLALIPGQDLLLQLNPGDRT